MLAVQKSAGQASRRYGIKYFFGNHTWIPAIVYPLEGGVGGMILLLDLTII